MLTQETLKQALHYDPETGIWTWKIRPALCVQIGDRAGCLDKAGYRKIQIEKKSYKEHRLAFLYMTGA